MRLSYQMETPNDQALQLARQIVEMIVASGITYRQADAALTTAQEKLLSNTCPVIDETCQQDISKWSL